MRTELKACVLVAAVLVCGVAAAIPIDFEEFYIRNNNGTITAPWDADMSIIENAAGDGFSASTPRSGQKVGYGTDAFGGMQVNLLDTVDFTKLSGKDGIVPYLNMWVTDGTHYAIISSENDYRDTDFQTRQQWKVFEYDTTAGLSWLFDSGTGARSGSQYLTLNGVNATLADLSDSIYFASPVAYPSYVGTGAPRGGYAFNVIFGDTQSNYVGSFAISDLSVTYDGETYEAVPEPMSLVMLGAIGAGMLAARRKRRAH